MATVTATVPDLSGDNLTSWLQAEHKTPLDLLRAAWGITLVSYTGSEDVWCRSYSQSGGYSWWHYHVSATQPVRSLYEIQPQENAPEEKGTVVWGQNSVVFEGEVEVVQDILKQFGLAVSFHQDTISISIQHNPAVLEQARMIAATAARAVSQIVRHTNSIISDLDLVSETDIARILQWNSIPYRETGRAECIHQVISVTASSQPSTTAVSSWDGDLTYGELERLSSALAMSLRHLGVRRDVFVPLIFDKSKWAIVAMLAVLKAGGAYFFLNPTHPVEYNKSLCKPFDIKLAVCLPKHHTLAQNLAPRFVELGNEAGKDLNLKFSSPVDEKPPEHESQETPSPSQVMYATFTSGTTGTPKSISTSHDAFYHMAIATASPSALHISPSTRMLQFASYTFDVANRDILIPLMFGGCVCVPSERERVEDLGGFIERTGVTLASLTPSMAGTLRPASVRSLKGLVLGGEQMTETHVRSWTSDEDNKVELFNAYGVSESTGIAALARHVQPGGGSSLSNIGHGNGSTLWVLSMTNPSRLAPVGALGELVIEGPSVARGYLNDPERTERSFQTQPEWKRAFLERLVEKTDGDAKSDKRFPWSRAFRTGDLVRYSPRQDGTLELVGRRDHQVKVNGQRLELAAVEEHVVACTKLDPSTTQFQHAAVVAVKTKGGGGGTKLFAFLGVETSYKSSAASLETKLEGSSNLQEVMQSHLSKRMPAFMVPSEFMFLQNMPLTSSGKIDRVLLQETAIRGLSDRQARTSAAGGGGGQAGSEITTAAEKILLQAWSKILDIDEEGISREDCFFRRGGDSIAAIKLAAHLREKGIQIKVEDVFKHSTLADMAALPVLAQGVNASTALSQASPQPSAVPPPFSLLKAPQAIIPTILEEVGLSRDKIEDIYPATHIQAGLIALTAQDSSAYIGSYTWPVRHEISIVQLKQAWEKVWRMNPVLRTRILQVPEGLFQVVIESGCDIPWTTVEDVDESRLSVEIAVDGKSPLVRFYQSKKALRLDIHHALFDEWSLDLLLAQVEKAYAGQPLSYRHFSPFVQNLLSQEQNAAAEEFWREEFAGLRTEHFPPGSTNTASTAEKIIVEHSLSLDRTMTSVRSQYTLSTTLRLAWGIILSHQTGSPDVVFGATVTGRNADNLELTGPTLATLPVRIKVPGDQAIHKALEEAQKGFANMMAHQQTGLPRIRAASSEAADACGFQNLLVVQQQTAKMDTQDSSRSSIFETSASTEGSKSPGNAKTFASYPLVLTCRPSQHSITFTAAVNPTLLDSDTTHGMLRQMAHVVQQILSSTSSSSSSEAHDLRIREIDLMPRQDVEKLTEWNGILPAGVETPIHHTIRKKADSQPEKVAVHSYGLDLTYAQVERYSNLFSQHLLAAGVKKGDFVPLLLERSPWAPVLMLAVLKLGAAFALLDLSHPVQRLRTMCTVLSAKRVVCFPHHQTMVENDLLLPEVIFDPEVITDVSKSTQDAPARMAEIDMDAPACVVFSSGSTGLPKAIQLPHRALSTSAYHLSTTGHLSQYSRVFHFASFAFDLSIGELLFSLSAGATVCVPTEEERRANPSKAAGDLGVTWALLTPSVIDLLDPEEVPTLQVLASAGEQLTTPIVERWAGRVMLFNMYAPAECTVISHISHILPGADTPPACIGRSPGAVSWVASQDDHHKLVPIGTIGELLVEGPVVSSGYLGDAEKTDAVFLSPSNPPSWLTQVRGAAQGGKIGRVYKTGDLVRQREDGTLLFLGRKDDQIKLHGQRLEAEEVEQSITSLCSSVRKVAVDIVKITEKGGGKRAFLVAFVAPHEFEDWGEVGKDGGLEVIQDPNDNFYTTIESLYTSLQDTLPSYMLPSYFIPFSKIPLSLSGKVNRKLLREESTTLLGSQDHREKYQLRTLTAREQARDGEQAPLTDHETQIIQIIAQVLHLDAQQVPINGNFFGIGGDSISAMRVAALARRKGLELSVAEIFKQQILSQIAASCCPGSDTDSTSDTDSSSRSLSESSSTTDTNSEKDSEKALGYELPPGLPQEVARQVELTLPASDFQTMTLYNFYSRYLWVSLPDNIDTERLQQACQMLTEKHSILRTVFYTTTTAASVVQLVLRSLSVRLKYHKDIESLEQHFTTDSMSHGPPINGAEGFQVQLLSLRDGQKRYLALRLPHAQFDGLSLNVLIEDLSAAYDDNTGHSLAPCGQFSDQVKCVIETKTTHEAYQVWKDILYDAEMTRLDGQILRRGDGVDRKKEDEESVQGGLSVVTVTAMTETAPLVAPAGFTMATLVKLAWALTLSRLFLPKQPNEKGPEGGRSVVFGQVIHGRSLSLPYEDRIVGPCLNIIPVRVRLPPTTPNLDDPASTRVLLEQIQSQHVATLPVENLSLSTITKHCTQWAPGTQFGSFVRFQNFEDDNGMRCSLNGESCETGLWSLPNKPSRTANLLIKPMKEGILQITLTVGNMVLGQRDADHVVGCLREVLESLAGGEKIM
ncbi:nonribosomal peptide synthetase [Diaporthe helianthi]|uniref:Nonribosomal peptide synthetase n=1 Tax=Diaporthe helianthi TaxID=158607 RepID=A0A2P5HLV4_DIAHE|nr:nonribosomal peptide synthetase [Diaporthe helianthi]